MANSKSFSKKTPAPQKKVASQSHGVYANQVLATILYYDMFDFPLTLEEIQRYVVGRNTFSLNQIRQELQNTYIDHKKGYFFLKGRESLVASRLQKEVLSKKKIMKARRIARMLGSIPTIVGVGVSGSLSMLNAKEDDDIDLFIITKNRTLWVSRLLVTGMLVLTRNLRRFGSEQVKDSICTNMWVDEANMAFPKNRQNIYTAHEIVQMKMLFCKHNINNKFMNANMWIHKFLPNTRIPAVRNDTSLSGIFFQMIEPIARGIQLWYMKKHQTSETITDGFVAFHPKDYTHTVLSTWNKRLKLYGI